MGRSEEQDPTVQALRRMPSTPSLRRDTPRLPTVGPRIAVPPSGQEFVVGGYHPSGRVSAAGLTVPDYATTAPFTAAAGVIPCPTIAPNQRATGVLYRRQRGAPQVIVLDNDPRYGDH